MLNSHQSLITLKIIHQKNNNSYCVCYTYQPTTRSNQLYNKNTTQNIIMIFIHCVLFVSRYQRLEYLCVGVALLYR